MAENMVICIARQFGSGGRQIGHALADALDIAFYDKELLKAAADKSGILQELFEKSDERPVSGLAHAPSLDSLGKAANFADYTSYLPNDRMQNTISQVIAEAADTSPCVIIGRCADYVLRGRKCALSVFIHAPLEVRIHRVARLHNLDEDKARSLIRKTDRSRANYYSYYTDRDWGAVDTYHLSLDSNHLGIEGTVAIIQNAAKTLCAGS